MLERSGVLAAGTAIAVLIFACVRRPDDTSASGAPSMDGGLDVEAAAGSRPEAGLRWIVMARALELLQKENGGAALVDEFFNTPQTYVIGALTDSASVPPKAVVTDSFTSYVDFDAPCGEGAQRVGGLKNALDKGLDPRVGAVVYDNERWCLTPVEEQAAPATYEALAKAAIHARGLPFISTPATDLVQAVEPGFGGKVYPEFLNLGIARAAATSADVYEIQAQGSLPAAGTAGTLANFLSFVTGAATQARTANPRIVVLAGVSTNPSAGDPSAYTLCQAVMQTRGAVDGYWLNVPVPGTACPSCNAPRPDVAVGLLRQLKEGACDPDSVP
jgi:hypothetical protein